MKKRILAVLLVLCMLLPMIPFTAFAAASVEGLTYNSVFARDVVFGNVPISHWYEGLAGNAYQNGYDAGTHSISTDYATYIAAFDKMVGFGDAVIDAGTIVSNGFDAEDWYADIPSDLVGEMNAVSNEYGKYVTREIWGKAHKWNKDIDNLVEGSDAYATRATQYVYSYTFDPTQEPGYTGPANLPKMIINTGTQSDEKGAIYGTYYLLYDLLNNWENDPVLDYLRHNVILVIVPCLSPGGINQNTYWNANNVNINRNFSVNFAQVGGYSYVAAEGGDYNHDKAKDAYVAVAAGTGAYVRKIDVDGLYSADGTNIKSNLQTYSQNSGLAAFDQSEACILRDLIAENADAFYYTDFHTNTNNCLSLNASGNPQWHNMNWQAIGAQSDAYGKKLVHAASWHIDRLTENFVRQYKLDEYGWTEDKLLGNITQSDANGTSNIYVKSQNILSTTLEAISGFPLIPDGNGGSITIHGGRYSPLTQKACSEVLGNWLIAILGEYAYEGNLTTGTFTTSFDLNMGGNYPTIENLPVTSSGNYDTTALPRQDGVADKGFFALSSLKNEDGTEKYPLTFNGNWSLGYKKVNGVGTFNDNPDNFTPFGVYVRQYATYLELYFAGDTTVFSTTGRISISQTRGSATMSTSTSKTAYGGSQTNQTAVYGNDTTIRYTAEYDGNITVNVRDVLFAANTCQLIVLKNGVEIGRIQPEKESCSYFVSDNGVWSKPNGSVGTAGTFTTTVQAGDHIDFVNHNNVADEKATCKWPLTYDMMTQNNYKFDNGESVGNIWERYRDGVRSAKISISYTAPAIAEIEADYSGTNADTLWTYPANVSTLETFLTWYDANGKAIANSGSLTGATAKINPDLIKAGYIKSTDTWEQAIDGYFRYLDSLSDVTYSSGWVAGALEKEGDPFTKGSVFSPITEYALFTNGFNLFSVSSTGTYEPRFGLTGVGVTKTYFNAQLALVRNASSLLPASENGKAASQIEIPYTAELAATLNSVGYKAGNPTTDGVDLSGHKYMVAGVNFTQQASVEELKGVLLRTQYSGNTVALAYTVPSGMKQGVATLSLKDMLHNSLKKNYRFSLYLNGTALIEAQEINIDTEVTQIQALLANLGSFEVKAGDRIELRFTRISGACYMSPVLDLDIVQKGDKWTGDYGSETTVRESYETFFKWYDGESGNVIANGGTVTSDDYMLINPYFTAANATYKITADMTYREAIAVYKNYLRSYAAGMVSKNNWQLVAMEGANAQTYGTNLVPIMYPDILERESVFGLTITQTNRGSGNTPQWGYAYKVTADGIGYYDNKFMSSPDVWVSATQFETQLQLFFDEVYYDRSAKKFKDVESSAIAWDAKIGSFDEVGENGLTFDKISAYRTEGNAYKDYEVPYAWNSNGGNWPTAASIVAQKNPNTDQAAYKGMVLRPMKGYGAGVMYTVPRGKSGAATLYIDQLYFGSWDSATTIYNADFSWNVLVNGVEQFATWQTSTKNGDYRIETAADSARVQAINEALATLDLQVKTGDEVAFCVRYLSANIYVSPSLEIAVTSEPAAVHRVQYASGGKILGSVLAEEGSSIADLLAAFRESNGGYAANGCYVDGVWYDADVEFPAVGATDIVLDDFKLNTSVSLTIGSTYSINVYLNAVEGATAAGVRLYGVDYPATKQADGKWKVVIEEVYAKDLLDTAVAYAPYYRMQDGSERTGRAIVVRAAELLATYIGNANEKVSNLARAALDYATVAKAYFAGDTASADVLERLSTYDAEILGKTPGSLNKTSSDYTFAAATLQIGETINFVFAIGAADGSHLNELDAILTVDGKSVSTDAFIPAWVGSRRVLLAVIEGVPESHFSETMTFRLQDASGNDLATLDYSVQDYCIRNLASAKASEANMIRAIYAIGKAATAYEG